MAVTQSGKSVGILMETVDGLTLTSPTVTGATQSGGSATALTSLGVATGGTVGLYGTTPITQRAGAAQATSLVGTASSTAVDTALKAAILEIMNTLAALGAWKGSA